MDIREYDQELFKSIMRKSHVPAFPFIVYFIHSYKTLVCRKEIFEAEYLLTY